VDLDVLFWLVIAGIVLAWLAHAVPEPSQVFGGIFGFREALWPSGVQEDDDAHWSWARLKRERPAAPEIVETHAVESRAVDVDRHRPDDPDRGTPAVVGGRYEVRAPVRAQVRSADHARS
jgi:hypothetical protein